MDEASCASAGPDGVPGNTLLQTKKSSEAVKIHAIEQSSMPSAHLADSGMCISLQLQEAHLTAIRHHATLLSSGARTGARAGTSAVLKEPGNIDTQAKAACSIEGAMQATGDPCTMNGESGMCSMHGMDAVLRCDIGQFEACKDQQQNAICSVKGMTGTCHAVTGWPKYDEYQNPVGTNNVYACNYEPTPIEPPTQPPTEPKPEPEPTPEVSSSLKEAVLKGTTTLPIVSNSPFSMGGRIVIDQGTAMEEYNTIIGFGSLLLQDPLKYDHGAGVTVLSAAGGAPASLDAAGFKAVTSLCCPPETEAFFNRLLDSMGLQVCSKPHIQGLMHWFSCVPDMDFQYMLDVINNGNPCKYWAAKGAECPILTPTCEGKWCR